MSLFAPINLLWLLPFTGALLALYFLRPRRRDEVVPSLLLWSAITQSTRSDKPFQKLKMSLLLLLQLLALLLLIFILSVPFSNPFAVPKASYVIVLDQSVGMQASDVQPNRYTVAQQSAVNFVESKINDGSSAAVVGAADEPILLCQLTSNRAAIISAIMHSSATSVSGNIADAVTFAHSTCQSATSIIIWSDGSWNSGIDSDLVRRAVSPLHLVEIGTNKLQNAGIAGLSTRIDTAHPSEPPDVLVTVERSHSANAVLTLSDGSHMLGSSKMPSGDGSVTKVFKIPTFTQTAFVTARLSGMQRDDLTVDNNAAVYIRPAASRTVLLVTDGDPLLERALALLPNVSLYEEKPSEFNPKTTGYDLVVYDKWLPDIVPPGSALVFGAINTSMPVVPGSGSSSPDHIVDWDEADPLLSYADLSSAHILNALSAEPALWGKVIAEMQYGPAIVKGAIDGRNIVWFSFSPADTDLTHQVAFPILLSNAVDILTVGGSMSAQTELPGAVDISIKPHPLLSPYPAGSIPTALFRADLTPPLALAALVVIAIEWLIYNRPLRYTRPI